LTTIGSPEPREAKRPEEDSMRRICSTNSGVGAVGWANTEHSADAANAAPQRTNEEGAFMGRE
jgi:hypothetical protein